MDTTLVSEAAEKFARPLSPCVASLTPPPVAPIPVSLPFPGGCWGQPFDIPDYLSCFIEAGLASQVPCCCFPCFPILCFLNALSWQKAWVFLPCLQNARTISVIVWLSPISDRIELPSIKSYCLIHSFNPTCHCSDITWGQRPGRIWYLLFLKHCDQDPGGSLGLNSCVWCILAPVDSYTARIQISPVWSLFGSGV